MSETKKKRTEVKQLGEFGLIDHLTRDYRPQRASTLYGVGDDAAVLDYGGPDLTLVTTDMLLEGIHFDLMYNPLKHLGHKAVIANLSDIYAMNGTPEHITVSMALSNRFSVEALTELYEGIYAACHQYGVDVVGGDTTSSQKGLVLSITAMGRVPKEKVTYRNGAKVGDILCVTGNLGAAYLGLQLLEREKQVYLSTPGIKPDLENEAFVIGRQLKPEARKDMIEIFAKENFIPTAMIDVSDGLASEVLHICKQSDTGAFIEEADVPIHPDAKMLAIKFNLDPVTCALNGGEDYELVFTADIKDLAKIKVMPDIYIIGEIVNKADGVTLHTEGGKIHPVQAQGWKHF